MIVLKVVPAWMVWLVPDDEPARAFTNFYRPVMEPGADVREPDLFRCRFTPERGVITLEHDGWAIHVDLGGVRLPEGVAEWGVAPAR